MLSSAPARVLWFLLLPLGAASAVQAADTPPAAAANAVEFVMPAAGASIVAGPVVIAGRLPPGAGALSLLLDDVPVADVTRDGRMFSAALAPVPGPHALVARAGGLEARLTFTYGSRSSGPPPYRYHTPVLERRCAECHSGVRGPRATAEADTCRSCHRMLAVIYPYVHGPVAAGKCTVCHEPHGSTWPSLAIADARTMCTRCHDQPGSLEHAENARSRVCYLCHNPHASMNRKFLYDIVK